MIHTELHLVELLGTTLNSRDEADALFARMKADLPATDSYVLNFSGVTFTSRSFADQFHKLKIRWQAEFIVPIVLENMHEQTLAILGAVAQTQQERRHKVANIPTRQLPDFNAAFKFLLTI